MVFFHGSLANISEKRNARQVIRRTLLVQLGYVSMELRFDRPSNFLVETVLLRKVRKVTKKLVSLTAPEMDRRVGGTSLRDDSHGNIRIFSHPQQGRN